MISSTLKPTKLNHMKIDLKVGDQLTSISCGHIIVELVKFILYQRQQIPYTYSWLKQVINKRKSCEEEVKESLASERHYRIVSTALENLDFILKSLLLEINGSSMPDEICIALGGTPTSCKEVYRLIMPTVYHKQQCQSSLIASDQKIQMNVFRSLAQKLSQFLFNHLPPTNMHIYIKRKILGSQETVISDTFEQIDGFRIPRTSKIVIVDFSTENYDGVACCNTFQIFGDNNVKDQPSSTNAGDADEIYEIESTDSAVWYQSCYVVKGFKDCIVDGTSIANSWINS